MIKIGILGLGNVGKGVLDILSENATLLEQRVGEPITIKSIAVRDINKYQDLNLGDIHLTTDVQSVLNDPEISIIVELIGGENPAFDYICTALKNKKFVVTANKEVISKHKHTFFELAQQNKVDIYFEAAVAGGIPIIRSLKVGFAANKIESLFGILNGTTNYILTKIEEEQKEFSDVLKEAQSLGLAEADPTMDIAGLDAAHKLVILAAVAFKVDIQMDDIYYEGIENITLKDITYAKELGYSIKLLAIARRINDQKMAFRVHPTMIPVDHPLSRVRNEENAVFVIGNAVGESLLSGKGAGGSPTGSAVVSDIIDIAFDASHQINRRNLETNLEKVELVPMELTNSQYFMRLIVSDNPRVLEKITGTLGNNKISISKILQKETQNLEAELVIVTHLVQEKDINLAVAELKSFTEVKEICSLIRVRLDEG